METPRTRIPLTYHRLFHTLALLTTAATFPLIFMGGLVTSKGAGMAVPDWPTSFHHNMFALPWHYWAGGVFYEHTHRLLGTVVGLCAIALTIVAWWVEPRRWVRWLATSVLFAVTFQGVLGGLRVLRNDLDLAILHGCIAQAFFCLSGLVAVVTSRFWLEARRPDAAPALQAGRQLVRLGALCVALIYVQLIMGALVRHYHAGVSIPDFPLHYGSLVPPINADELAQVNVVRAMRWNLDPEESLGRVWLHMGHRAGAFVVTVGALTMVLRVLRDHRQYKALARPAVLLAVLLFLQLTLGVSTVLFWAGRNARPVDLATMHVAVGALLLLTSFVLTARAIRLFDGPEGLPAADTSRSLQRDLPDGATALS